MPNDNLEQDVPKRTGKLSVHPSILQPKGMTSVFREYFHKIFLPFLKRGDNNNFQNTLERETEQRMESSPLGARKGGVAGKAFNFFKQGSTRDITASYRMDKLKALGSEVYKALKHPAHPKDQELLKHFANKSPAFEADEVSELMAMELAEQNTAKRKKFNPDEDTEGLGQHQARRPKKVRRSGLR